MPVTIKSAYIKYKDAQGQYVGVDTIAETSTAEQIAAIEAKGEEILENIPNFQPAVIVETISSTTPSITGEDNHRYICGTVSSISITTPLAGIIDVVFTSGTTPAVLTALGVVWPGWFDPNSLNASTVYDITIKDGYGVVNTWT